MGVFKNPAATSGSEAGGRLPTIPDDDADFTPDLARKIIAGYQQLLLAKTSSPAGGLAMPSRERMREKIVSDPDVEDCGAATSGSEAGGWQDIKTAPKGRKVLVKFQSGEVEVCYQTDHGGGLMDSWRYAFARRGEQAPWPTEWCEIPGAKPSSPADVREIDEISEAIGKTGMIVKGDGSHTVIPIAVVARLLDLARAVLSPSTSAAEPVNEPHRFAVVSSDFCRPFLLGAYASFEAAQKAQCGSPEKWPIYERLYAHPAPAPPSPPRRRDDGLF